MWCSVVVVVVVVVVVAVVVVVVVCQSDLENADFTEDGWPASRWLVWPLGIRFLLRETELACVAFGSDGIKLNEVEKLVTLKLSASKTDPSAKVLELWPVTALGQGKCSCCKKSLSKCPKISWDGGASLSSAFVPLNLLIWRPASRL